MYVLYSIASFAWAQRKPASEGCTTNRESASRAGTSPNTFQRRRSTVYLFEVSRRILGGESSLSSNNSRNAQQAVFALVLSVSFENLRRDVWCKTNRMQSCDWLCGLCASSFLIATGENSTSNERIRKPLSVRLRRPAISERLFRGSMGAWV